MHVHIVCWCTSYVNEYVAGVPSRARRAASDPRPDLAAMVVPLGRSLVAAELPILERHGVSMWAYVVLGALASRQAPTQSALAQAIGADKTRIIGVLDDLQARGLIARGQGETDRRAHVLALTPSGRLLHRTVQDEIQRGEDERLAALTPSERVVFLRALRVLSGG